MDSEDVNRQPFRRKRPQNKGLCLKNISKMKRMTEPGGSGIKGVGENKAENSGKTLSECLSHLAFWKISIRLGENEP